ncbi:MAG: c-type cytochrome [Gemmatimonadota bacterium]|jgi:putative heme-binding domain-containing protein
MRSFFRSSAIGGVICVLLQVAPAAAAAQLADHQYTSAAIEAGSRLYVSECALCHGPQGDRVDGIDLRRGQFRGDRSDDDLRRIISTGVDDSRMPAFDFSAAEMDGIIAYIRAGFDPSGVAVRIGDADRGRQVFQGAGECSSCHRVNGVGPRTAPDLSDIGAIRTPQALQRTLLDPYTALLPINRPVVAITQDGERVRGRRLNEDTYSVQMIDSEGRLRSFVKDELVDFEVSRTPTHLPTTLSGDQLADVIGYLLSLQGLP